MFIKVIMDIRSALRQEGTGVDDLVITANTFTMCNYSDRGTVIEIGSNIADEEASSYIFTDIEISSDTFENMLSRVLNTNNVNGLVFSNNTIDTGDTFEKSKNQGKLYLKKYCANIIYEITPVKI